MGIHVRMASYTQHVPLYGTRSTCACNGTFAHAHAIYICISVSNVIWHEVTLNSGATLRISVHAPFYANTNASQSVRLTPRLTKTNV